MRLHVWIGIGVSLWMATLPAAAQWKWKDARGYVVISDTPPPREIPERDVLQKPTLVLQRQAAPAQAASAPVAAAKPKVDAELEARRQKAEDEQKAKQQAQQKAEEQRIAAVRADNCKRARAYADTLNSGIRMTRLNSKGEQEYIDDAQRAAELQRARQAIESECR